MDSLEITVQDAQDPQEEGWIPLSAAHLLPWALLFLGVLQDLAFSLLPYPFRGMGALGWTFALLRWGLGGLAIAVALQARSRKVPGALRQAGFGIAAAAFCLGVCASLVLWMGHAMNGWVHPTAMFLHGALAPLAVGGLILLFLGREPGSGDAFDAAAVSLAALAGLGWMILPVLAIAALCGHPLMTVLWRALRNSKAALEGGWFDGQDEALRLKELAACALACSIAAWVWIAWLLVELLNVPYVRRLHSPFGAATELLATLLAGLLLGIYVGRRSRRTGLQAGRAQSLVAVWMASLPLACIVLLAILLVLVLTNVIHFRLF